MASVPHLQTLLSAKPVKQSTAAVSKPYFHSLRCESTFLGSKVLLRNRRENNEKQRTLTVVAAVGDVSADGTTYLIAGAAAVALVGTAFPILFTRKDLCPECDGAGFVRKSGAALRANAARKDQAQIVCPTCNGLGKLNQIDK